jgi:hypothetical protein
VTVGIQSHTQHHALSFLLRFRHRYKLKLEFSPVKSR